MCYVLTSMYCYHFLNSLAVIFFKNILFLKLIDAQQCEKKMMKEKIRSLETQVSSLTSEKTQMKIKKKFRSTITF